MISQQNLDIQPFPRCRTGLSFLPAEPRAASLTRVAVSEFPVAGEIVGF